MGRRGAVGSLRSCGSPRKEAIASTACSAVALDLSRTNTAIVCPSVTATRCTEAEMRKGAWAKAPLAKVPRIRSGSVSIFSSSPPPMYGITLSAMSIDATPG